MSAVPHPWDTRDLEQNWQGYFVPGTSILRSRVGALTREELRDAENDLVEARVIELREAPDLLGNRSYDLVYLQAIHRQLFQYVYEWVETCGPSASRRATSPSVHRAASTSPWTTSPQRLIAMNRVVSVDDGDQIGDGASGVALWEGLWHLRATNYRHGIGLNKLRS